MLKDLSSINSLIYWELRQFTVDKDLLHCNIKQIAQALIEDFANLLLILSKSSRYTYHDFTSSLLIELSLTSSNRIEIVFGYCRLLIKFFELFESYNSFLMQLGSSHCPLHVLHAKKSGEPEKYYFS
jgi:hypothetical protein